MKPSLILNILFLFISVFYIQTSKPETNFTCPAAVSAILHARKLVTFDERSSAVREKLKGEFPKLKDIEVQFIDTSNSYFVSGKFVVMLKFADGDFTMLPDSSLFISIDRNMPNTASFNAETAEPYRKMGIRSLLFDFATNRKFPGLNNINDSFVDVNFDIFNLHFDDAFRMNQIPFEEAVIYAFWLTPAGKSYWDQGFRRLTYISGERNFDKRPIVRFFNFSVERGEEPVLTNVEFRNDTGF